MSLSNLKKDRGRKTADLADAAAKMNKPGGSFDDDRFWKPSRDKSDNGYAIIRFLPAVEGENLPWIRIFSHGFKGPKGQWYIENCPTTISGKCPACERNTELWNSGIDAKKNIARNRKRRLQYISNVYIVSDPKNPENEGRVFLYKYGMKIFTKLMDAMDPDFEDEKEINPFCFWDGADFKIKIRNVEGFVNYDKSEFAAASQFLDGDEKALEALYEGQHKLQPFIDASEFKEYKELRDRVQTVLESVDTLQSSAADAAAEAAGAEETSADVAAAVHAEQAAVRQEAKVTKPQAVDTDDDEDSPKSAHAYFEGLANED